MKNTENTQENNKLNPEIKEKAEELFDLIEKAEDNWHSDELLEVMAEEMGEMLRSHRGMEELYFAYKMSRTKSQEAEHDLESSTWYMADEALKKYYDLARTAMSVLEALEDDEPDIHTLFIRAKGLKDSAPEIYRKICSEYRYRSESYLEEIRELKQAS